MFDCFTETHGTWPDINSLIGHAKQFEAFSFVSRNLTCKFFHRAFFDFFFFLPFARNNIHFQTS